MSLTDVQARELSRLVASLPELEAEHARRRDYLVNQIFQADGPYRRDLYVKWMAFFREGTRYQERLLLAGNRTGKTRAAAFEIRCHITGRYPDWWEGFRFARANHWWVAGDTMETTRNITQVELLGPYEGVPHGDWRGMVDAHLIDHYTRKSGAISNCVDAFWIRHVAGGLSSVAFKSFDQGRRSFQGTEKDGIWLDEEPPEPESGASSETSGDIYTECLMRLMTTGGPLISTFTPLRGLTGFVSNYIETADMIDMQGQVVKAADNFWPKETTV